MKDKTILIVDDTISNLDILAELLGEYDVLEVTNGKDALEIVKDENIDLILLDIMMPEMDGYKVCKILKADENTKSIPIIFITTKSDEDSIEKAYDMGGTDYVTKPFKPKELLARVKKELRIHDLIQNLEKTQKELKYLASTDSMTGLYNRRYFSKISKDIMYLARREKKDLSIIMLDIDKFKNVNDTYGHKVGDDVIISLAVKLVEFTRKSDIACRFGGEEFIILLSDTNIEGASVIAQKIREVVEDSVVAVANNKNLKYTISVGISQANLDLEQDMEATIHRADEALYEAKQSGRNKICIKNNY